mgnify:CR=1 FL=1
MSNRENVTIDFSTDSHYDEKILTGLKLYLRFLTYRDILKHIKKRKVKNVTKVLELGSGSGYFLKLISKAEKVVNIPLALTVCLLG